MQLWKRSTAHTVQLQSGNDSFSSDDEDREHGSSSRFDDREGISAGTSPSKALPGARNEPPQSSISHRRRGSFTAGAASPVVPLAAHSFSSPNSMVTYQSGPLMQQQRHLPGSGRMEQHQRQLSIDSGRLANTHGDPASGRLLLRRTASLASMNSSFAFGGFTVNPTTVVSEARTTTNILVVGAPQVGKSMFVNVFRAAVMNNTKWPAAPVGICGFYGTTCVEPFPNNPASPTWLCIDTPGRFYDAKDEVILEKLVAGIPWRTKLMGPKSLTLGEVEDITPIAANRAHQVVIVIPATDLIEDHGWGTHILRWVPRYSTAPDAESVVLYIKGLAGSLRALMSDAVPFIVVSKMDKLGGAGSTSARKAICALLGQCVPVNRIYFSGCAAEGSSVFSSVMETPSMDASTRQAMLQLHEDICFAVHWKNRVDVL